MGFGADVVCVTNPGLLFEALQSRRGLLEAPHTILNVLFRVDRSAPMVTVLDGRPHTLAFLAGVHEVPATHVGVTRFGQSGDLGAVYGYHGLDTDTLVGTALDLID